MQSLISAFELLGKCAGNFRAMAVGVEMANIPPVIYDALEMMSISEKIPRFPMSNG